MLMLLKCFQYLLFGLLGAINVAQNLLFLPLQIKTEKAVWLREIIAENTVSKDFITLSEIFLQICTCRYGEYS